MMKKWLKIYLTVLFGILISVSLFNYLMDPLWCFSHKNHFQSAQGTFNERQQKINLMYFQPFKYDGLFLGSSKITIHDPTIISHHGKIFNLAFDGMRPYEFNEYIEYAKKLNHKEFKYIIIGLDFTHIEKNPNEFHINKYLKNTTSAGYRYKILFSYDTFIRSIKNFKYSVFKKHNNGFKSYDQNHIAHAYKKDPQYVHSLIQESVISMKNSDLIYDRNNYLKAIEQLKQNNPNTKFIIFTTLLPYPILHKLFESKTNQLTFELWLNDIYNEFGPFWHFLYKNQIIYDYEKYFVDPAHYTSEVANCINNKIITKECENPSFKNFGIYISDQKVLHSLEQDIVK